MARSTPATGARFLASDRGTRDSSSNRSPDQIPPGRHEQAALAQPLHPEHTAEKAGTVLVLRRNDIGKYAPAPTHFTGTYHEHGGLSGLPPRSTPPTTPASLRDNGTWRGGNAGIYKGKADAMRS